MKKIYSIIVLLLVSIVMVSSTDTVKVLRLYHNDTFFAIPLSSIDSIDHSKYDANGKLRTDYISTIIDAIDSTYNISISEIDSVVFANINQKEYKEHLADVNEWIFKTLTDEEELGLDEFQKKLMGWLNECDWVEKTTISNNLITITFTNGIESYIDFQDISFFEEVKKEAARRVSNPVVSSDDRTYYNVSYQDKETIIEKSDILLIQGRRMFLSNADKEVSDIANCRKTSPVFFNTDVSSHSLAFLDWDFSKYGLIIISQTHGMGNGSFQVEDSSTELISNYLLSLYYKDGKVTKVYNNFIDWSMTLGNLLYLYRVSPKLFGNRIRNSDAIVYGNYCWSSGLARWLHNTFFGYYTKSLYLDNLDYLLLFVNSMYNGSIFKDAITPLKKYYSIINDFDIIPSTNMPHSKQRFFSISTDDITKTAANGQPIISGKINGYENLKKDDLTYLIYFHKGDGAFSPENAQEDECMVLKIPGRNDISDFEIKEDGSFSFEFPGFLLSNTKYQMIFAFEYKDNYYFGETKFIEPEEKDNTISSGYLVDLGLSVKWASCNVGAEKPNQLGTKIKTDIISEAYKANPSMFNEDGTKADFCRSGYDLAYKQSAGRMRMPTYQELKELKEKCQWELSVVDGAAGVRIVGPNKNSIFLPADTEKTEQPYFGDSYMLNRTVYTSGTYDKEISWSWGLASIIIYGMYMPQLSMASFLNIEYGNDFEAYIRPVGD